MNKQLALLLTFMMCLFALQSFAQGVGFASTPITVHPSAIVEMRSNAKGFLAPRMTAAQRLAIVDPAMGLMVYDTDSSAYVLFNGTNWRALCYNTAGLTLPYTG